MYIQSFIDITNQCPYLVYKLIFKYFNQICFDRLHFQILVIIVKIVFVHFKFVITFMSIFTHLPWSVLFSHLFSHPLCHVLWFYNSKKSSLLSVKWTSKRYLHYMPDLNEGLKLLRQLYSFCIWIIFFFFIINHIISCL